ncbi:MAG TPA: substrate-binding domain-containing protein [Terriglobales bacterium]|nr:substrate-binding domain-containing protein [Terriglobales bacterium]
MKRLSAPYRMPSFLILGFTLLAAAPAARASDVVLYGAGSLHDALSAIAAAYTAKTGIAVQTAFGPSGLMREKVEAGDKVDLFASADMGHALKLQQDGKAAAVMMFTRNKLCVFAKPEIGLTAANFVERLTDPSIRIGTSTPKADPGGDYTWAMFHLMDNAKPGAFAILDAKAQKIVGGSTAPSGPDPIAAAFADGKINAMVGYCSGTEQRRKATPDLAAVEVPEPFATGPEYGLAIMRLDNAAAVGLALAIEGPEGQATLARFGFAPVGLPAKP